MGGGQKSTPYIYWQVGDWLSTERLSCVQLCSFSSSAVITDTYLVRNGLSAIWTNYWVIFREKTMLTICSNMILPRQIGFFFIILQANYAINKKICNFKKKIISVKRPFQERKSNQGEGLRPIHTRWKRKRKRQFSLMFVICCLICLTCSLIFSLLLGFHLILIGP